jgi:tetratricopeptide (TPR) repeat protein
MRAQNVDLQNLVYQKQYAAVVGYAAHLQKADSTDYRTMYAVGQAYEGLLRYREAYHCYLHCLTLGDDAPIDLLNAAARMAANIGIIREAEACFRRALAIDSVDFYANYQLARLYFQSGDYAEAADYYMFLIDKNPNNPVLLRGLGDCYSRMNFQPAAAVSYMQAFNLNKENTGLASTLINTLLANEQVAAALNVCDTALAYNPGNKLLLQSKSAALFTAKAYEQADSIYTLLLTQGDSSYMTLKYGGLSKYYVGRYYEAITPLDMAYQIDTSAVDVGIYLGSVLGRTYDRQRAYRLFDQAERLMQPKQSLVDVLTQFRAETYGRDGRRDEASALLYELWMKNKHADILARIWSYYSADISRINDETIRRRSLFLHVLIAAESENHTNNKQMLSFVRAQLQKFRDDLFFRGLTEHPMLAPDNKKSILTMAQLQESINRLSIYSEE